MKYYNKDPSNN